jgi:hypothetical protein
MATTVANSSMIPENIIIQFSCHQKKKRVPPGDVMKTPLLKDVSALRRCNPPAFRLTCQNIFRRGVGIRHALWPAIGKRSQLGFQCNLMSIPIEPAQLPVLSAKLRILLERTKEIAFLFCCNRRIYSSMSS